MERFTSYLDGMGLVDYLENSGGYNYFGYNRWGAEEWCIMKQKIDETTIAYLIGTELSNYATAWANKASLTFKSPSQFGV